MISTENQKNASSKPELHTVLGDVCSQCNNFEDELHSFNDEPKRCAYCMTVEGLCQNCGDYIPIPDFDDENDPLHALSESSDFAPEKCLKCFNENDT